ncbi:biotin-dependent carboxyltransferase family protein [Paenibacillus filicis]|uniref:Biotin-dependent carboxyltransferase family protein n=1 Tax=Paenibacillus gyeongsangnamensis TaxID=3388067 RepID=A0ABT4QDG9_9BACL|nr:biotin-dependent carboxyltransferase family protein [Paenibacillus filicis]MCZ8514750.1 biotin-dependent carboxyltransferase family protein [Paenibacillus filicis]
MSLHIINPGLLSTIQDLGRFGYQHQGVIVCGAMDSFALRAANVLVGNGQDEAALEITLLGPSIRFEGETLIAICGGDLSPIIDGQPVPLWRPVLVKTGKVLEFGTCIQGARAYLAIAGGIDVPLVMESRSTYLRAGLGGLEGRAMKAGDVLRSRSVSEISKNYIKKSLGALKSKPFAAAPWCIGSPAHPAYAREAVIRVIRGRDFAHFTEVSRNAFVCQPFRVTPQSDRMGYRMEGPVLELESPLEPISEGVSFGTVQVPSEGNPIILMADRQTIGGYPSIAQVVTVDLPVLAQVKPGEYVRFTEISLEKAEKLYIDMEQSFDLTSKAIGLYLKKEGGV